MNHRIVEWKKDATSGKVVAGGNGKGNQTNQLNLPSSVIVDKETDTLIICDWANRRVIQWSLRGSTTDGDILIGDIDCRGLAIDTERNLYISDTEKHEVRRYRMGETTGTLVAGGQRLGDRLDQLNRPTYVFVDGDQSVYVSDYYNHRVMKWMKGAKEGLIVAGGRGEGNALSRLWNPNGVFVDLSGAIYVADWSNHRLTRWCEAADQGELIVGGNGSGGQANQLNGPHGLSFDRQGNLYVVDYWNHRVQRFSADNS